MSTLKVSNIQDIANTAAMSISSGVVTFNNAPVGIPNVSGTILTSAIATTSGTSISFTGIPSTVKHVTIHYMGCSHAGSDNTWLFELGTSSALKTSGYFSTVTATGASNAYQQRTDGFATYYNAGAADLMYGEASINLAIASSHSWTQTGNIRSQNYVGVSGGFVELGGALNQIRIHTAGNRTFDAGSISISYYS